MPATSTITTLLTRSRRRSTRLSALAVAGTALTASLIGVSPTAAHAAGATFYQKTFTSTSWNGGCYAKTVVTYYPNSDQANMYTTVTSPYLFAACRVHAQLQVKTANSQFGGVTQSGMACAVLDPSCASTRGYPGVFQPADPAFKGFVDSVNAQLVALGIAPRLASDYATDINVAFSAY